MSNFVSFIGGTIFGAYIAQNYDVANVKESYIKFMDYLKDLEKKK